MRKIRILHVHSKMNRGGVESAAMNILRYINKDQFSFIFLCVEGGKYDFEDEIVELGAKIIRTPSPRDVGILAYLKLVRQIIQEEEVNIVHAHSNMVLSFIAAKWAGVNSRLAHSHTTGTETVPGIVKKVYILISKVIINLLCTYRLACSDAAGEYLFGRKSFKIIYNGIALDDFSFSINGRNKIRRQLGIPNKAMVIGHIGRMVPVKNQKFIIDVFEQYLKSVPDAYLLLIGDGYQKYENEQYAVACNVDHRVKFLGNRDDAGNLYNSMDIFIFPSVNEGLGLVLVEAQANGLMSLASDSVPHASKLTSGVEFYSLKRSTEEWALKLHSMDKKRFDARKTLEDGPYNISTAIKNIEDIYRKLGKGQ